MTKLLITSLLLLTINSVFAQNDKFIQFKERTATQAEWFQFEYQDTALNESISVDPFEMGNHITWKQYKAFLTDVKRMKGEFAYEELLPKLPDAHLKSCLETTKFDSSPVVGVSWTNAHEYCKWRMIVDNKDQFFWDDPQTLYRLPTRLEWISAYEQSRETGFKIDLKSDYSDWTLTSYDEAFVYLADYQYSPLKSDPPAMKRKRVMGSSFFVPTSNYHRSDLGYYQDSSYAHIGFRLIRVKDEYIDTDEIDTYLGDYFEEIWGNNEAFMIQEMVQGETFTARFHQVDNRMTGSYASFYPNGKQKSKGFYYKNQRIAHWTVWDSLGNKIVERNYLSPYRFEHLFPTIKDEQAKILRDAQMVNLSRNASGLINYPHVQERAVLWSKRYWSLVETEGNEQLFRKNTLINAIHSAVKSGDLRAYDTENDQFTDTISRAEFNRRLSGEVVAFKLKEDYFYDIDRGMASTRPVGICPIIRDTIDGTPIEREVAWFYFPHLRETLGSVHCFTTSDLIGAIYPYRMGGTSSKTLDDLFFYRNFEYRIVGLSNYKGTLVVEPESAQKELIELIEKEHDLWLQLYAR